MQKLYIAGDVNKENVKNIDKILDELEKCIGLNKQFKENAQQALLKYQGSLALIRNRSYEDLKRVRESLKHENCAFVDIPNDTLRVLRNRAASVNENGDS